MGRLQSETCLRESTIWKLGTHLVNATLLNVWVKSSWCSWVLRQKFFITLKLQSASCQRGLLISKNWQRAYYRPMGDRLPSHSAISLLWYRRSLSSHFFYMLSYIDVFVLPIAGRLLVHGVTQLSVSTLCWLK